VGAMALTEMIRDLELQLLDPKVRMSRALASSLLADDFVEFGSSGSVYDKVSVLDALAIDASGAPAMRNFELKLLGPDIALATFRTVRFGPSGEVIRQVLRSSIWRQAGGRWQLVFHQGTPAEGDK